MATTFEMAFKKAMGKNEGKGAQKVRQVAQDKFRTHEECDQVIDRITKRWAKRPDKVTMSSVCKLMLAYAGHALIFLGESFIKTYHSNATVSAEGGAKQVKSTLDRMVWHEGLSVLRWRIKNLQEEGGTPRNIKSFEAGVHLQRLKKNDKVYTERTVVTGKLSWWRLDSLLSMAQKMASKGLDHLKVRYDVPGVEEQFSTFDYLLLTPEQIVELAALKAVLGIQHQAIEMWMYKCRKCGHKMHLTSHIDSITCNACGEKAWCIDREDFGVDFRRLSKYLQRRANMPSQGGDMHPSEVSKLPHLRESAKKTDTWVPLRVSTIPGFKRDGDPRVVVEDKFVPTVTTKDRTIVKRVSTEVVVGGNVTLPAPGVMPQDPDLPIGICTPRVIEVNGKPTFRNWPSLDILDDRGVCQHRMLVFKKHLRGTPKVKDGIITWGLDTRVRWEDNLPVRYTPLLQPVLTRYVYECINQRLWMAPPVLEVNVKPGRVLGYTEGRHTGALKKYRSMIEDCEAAEAAGFDDDAEALWSRAQKYATMTGGSYTRIVRKLHVWVPAPYPIFKHDEMPAGWTKRALRVMLYAKYGLGRTLYHIVSETPGSVIKYTSERDGVKTDPIYTYTK